MAVELTGRQPELVINSHYHNDHIWGNQVFGADTDIISSDETRRMFIASRGHGAYESFMAEAEANLVSAEAQLESAKVQLGSTGADTLIAELQAADTIVISTPIYNFGVPATVKAWADLVARADAALYAAKDGGRNTVMTSAEVAA